MPSAKRSVVYVFFFVLISCVDHDRLSYKGYAYSSMVMQALEKREDAMSGKRARLEFASGAVATNCNEYLRLAANTTLKADVNNQLVKSEYLLCEALDVIGERKVSTDKPAGAYGQAVLFHLDLRSFPSSLSQRLDDEKHFLAQLGNKAAKADSVSATYETKDWNFRLELVATIDINKNGKPDWVLWMADEAKTGNYRHYQTLIIFDPDAEGIMRATPYSTWKSATGKR